MRWTPRAALTTASVFLETRVFPGVVTYATHPFVIAATTLLLIPLILDASNTSLVLVLGNYTNVVSASVSSIVLATSLHHHRENKQLQAQHAATLAAMQAQHAADLAAVHARLDGAPPPVAAATPVPAPPKRSHHKKISEVPNAPDIAQ